MKEPAIDRFAEVTDFDDNTGHEFVIGQNQDLQLERMKEAYRWARHGEFSGTQFRRKNISEMLKTHLLENDRVIFENDRMIE